MKKIVFLLGILFSGLALNAQIFNPVKWSTDYKQVSDDEFDLIFTAKIEDHWVVYSQEIGDDGPVPTSFTFDEGSHFTRIGKVEESGNRKKKYDKVFEMDLIKFYGKGIFTQRVKVTDISKPITGYLEFMTCNDVRCLPPTEVDFKFELKSTLKKDKKETPTPAPTPKQDKKKQPETPKVAIQEQEKKTANTGDQQADLKIKLKNEPTIIGEGKPTATPTAKKPIAWNAHLEKDGNDLYTLVFDVGIKDGWAVYSQFTDEGGPIPTYFEFDKGDHFELIGKTEEIGKKKSGNDPLFGVNVIKFPHGPISFKQKLKITDTSKPITGMYGYMACDDKQCIGPFDNPFKIDIANNAVLLDDAAEAPTTVTPIPNTSLNNSKAAAFPPQGGVYDSAQPNIQASYKTPLGDCGAENVVRNQSLFWTFIFGFLGGLVALLTPCVFPMIPLTVSFFTKRSKDKATGIKNAITYGLSIIVIYVGIGLLITGAFGATALQDLSTNWIANVLFFIIFIFFAFSFFGYYEITLPSSLSTKSDQMSERGGMIGIFFMAFTLAIVSFSCTGPIIGSALVASATNTLGPAVVMLGFSVALALPFALFAAFPGWLNSLPKSGGWMTVVKVVLGYIELALAFKFLSVADMTSHWGILPYEVYMGIWILCFAALTLYLFRVYRFPHDSPKTGKLPLPRMITGLIFLAFTIYLATGFKYNDHRKSYESLALLSGIAPPAHYNIFLPEVEVDPVIKAKYPSFTKCANNLDCFKVYSEGVAYAKEVNKPILLDFTGYGCVNCRKTEEHIWVLDKVWNRIADDYVLVSLYTDDREKLENPPVSKHNNKKMRTVGSLWQDFQITNFEQNSQPLYVLMTPDEKVMAAPRGYNSSQKGYIDFLNCGLDVFGEYSKK